MLAAMDKLNIPVREKYNSEALTDSQKLSLIPTLLFTQFSMYVSGCGCRWPGHGRTFFWKAIWFQTRLQHLGAFNLFHPCRTQVCSCKFGRSTRRERIRRWRSNVSAGGCVAWGGHFIQKMSCVCFSLLVSVSQCNFWKKLHLSVPGGSKTAHSRD